MEQVTLDTATLEYTLRRSIERMAERLLTSPTDLSLLQKLEAALDLTRSLPFMVNLWKPQNAQRAKSSYRFDTPGIIR